MLSLKCEFAYYDPYTLKKVVFISKTIVFFFLKLLFIHLKNNSFKMIVFSLILIVKKLLINRFS